MRCGLKRIAGEYAEGRDIIPGEYAAGSDVVRRSDGFKFAGTSLSGEEDTPSASASRLHT